MVRTRMLGSNVRVDPLTGRGGKLHRRKGPLGYRHFENAVISFSMV